MPIECWRCWEKKSFLPFATGSCMILNTNRRCLQHHHVFHDQHWTACLLSEEPLTRFLWVFQEDSYYHKIWSFLYTATLAKRENNAPSYLAYIQRVIGMTKMRSYLIECRRRCCCCCCCCCCCYRPTAGAGAAAAGSGAAEAAAVVAAVAVAVAAIGWRFGSEIVLNYSHISICV